MSTESGVATEAHFPMERRNPLDPPPELMDHLGAPTRVRLQDGQRAWLVTTYEDAKAVLASRTVSADVRRPGYPRVSEALATWTEGLLQHMDSPEHDIYRRMLAPEFMVKRVERLRPQVQEIVAKQIDTMMAHGSPVDLVAQLASPVPAHVTCALLGVPFEDHEYFLSLAEMFVGSVASVDDVHDAIRAFREYIGRLVDERIDAPTDDVIGYMASTYVADGSCSRDQLITLAQLLLIAGFDTTVNMIGLGVLALLQHPDQMRLLQEDPHLINRATEELLRWVTVTQWGRHRVATEEITLGGVTIQSGEGLIVSESSANRDPAAFENPNTLDVTRDARGHLAFGHGVHQCIGAALARLELQETYRQILERMPGLRLAVSLDDIEFKRGSAVYGAREVLVEW